MTDLAGAAAEFADLARNLRLVGEEDLRAELYRACSDAMRPVQDEVRQGLDAYMPNRYAETLNAALSFTTSKTLTGDAAGVKLLARASAGTRSGRRVRRLDSGLLWHPLYGDRKHWFLQAAPGGGMRAGFFSDAARRAAPRARDQIIAAMRRVAEKAVGR